MTSASTTDRILRQTHAIRQPAGVGPGYWAGAPGVYYSREERAFYVTYRIRRPRGVPPDRGGEARIARSTDLRHFEDIWSVTKDVYDTVSIERGTIRRGADGLWRYFTSFVDPADGRWCVNVLKSSDPRRFAAATTRPLFTAGALGLEGVKDPWIFEDADLYYMLLSVATPNTRTREESHATLDIFNTGDCLSATGLASSRDLDSWDWLGVVFAPSEQGWDGYCRRINSIIRHDGRYIGFYDGSASHRENYEERTGLAVSTDLRSWEPLTLSGPALISPHASGSLRYLDAASSEAGVWAFYEYARPDGSHELRVAQLDVDRLARTFDGREGSAT
jgi:hypothetical protein